MLKPSEKPGVVEAGEVDGTFLTIDGERYYAIRNVDRMPPFFMSITSNVDHWLFVSSTGGLTAGRVSPETALFPYIAVDKIHESSPHTGSKTVLRVSSGDQQLLWEPFNREHDGRYSTSRNLYKSVLGNKLRFEEINHDLQLAFRYTWVTSDPFGFVRQCELENLGAADQSIHLLDGLQNLLPAGTPRSTQSEASNLVNAYKWNELYENVGMAVFTLYSPISDRAEPLESLKANTVFCLGLDDRKVLLSSNQLNDFRTGKTTQQETLVRGIRGAYFVTSELRLSPGGTQNWRLVANTDQSQVQVVEMLRQLQDPSDVDARLERSVEHDTDDLARIMAAADGFQSSAEENVTAHHYANVLFNVFRGGIFDDQYNVSSRDLADSILHFNKAVYERHRVMLEDLPDTLSFSTLLDAATVTEDPQLARLCYEYLPITFGRRHGDPSRPWNQFAIKLKDEHGDRLLSYQGNWRDIFQNWEALAFSYPEFTENIIAKFVNASTMDGYNPYRITKEGIDWEIAEPDDPWSNIGYWGDHQIIYLLKLLELSQQFHPARLARLLREPIFSYANVPYRIKDFEALLDDPKNTVVFDEELAHKIEDRVASMGADGKLVLDNNGDVYQVNLLDKLLIPLLSKLGNFVVNGGIWLNTQRPEWNDANNALVGHGLSMVTLYYMRRYVSFLQELIDDDTQSVELSIEVTLWLTETATALHKLQPLLVSDRVSPDQRYQLLRELGSAAERYRHAVYGQGSFSGKAFLPVANIQSMLHDTLAAIDYSIASNRREDGLYHAYNVLHLETTGIDVDDLYPMLEGQVAVLSSGAIPPREAVSILDALFDSKIFRADQNSFMLYPDRDLPGFLDKNQVPASDVERIPLLKKMLDAGDTRIGSYDSSGCYRFDTNMTNVEALNVQLDSLASDYGDVVEAARKPLQDLYETVFRHKEFTGRSGTMFGFEGLGSIYWHMVAKLMLAIEENYFWAIDAGDDSETRQRLGQLYYRVREGIGFNKSPAEYGAFPTDPYSHTPMHAGARQPGMTGQVKEEILCRYAELGIRVNGGRARFQPNLLRACEFSSRSCEFEYLDTDGDWKSVTVPANGLAFTWCQVPVIYMIGDDGEAGVDILRRDGSVQNLHRLELTEQESAELVQRGGSIRQLTVTIAPHMLFAD